MKEFDVRERKSAILTMVLLGVFAALYEFLVPTVMIIRVFKLFVPVVWVLIVLFFIVSQFFFAKDRIALAEADPQFATHAYSPITTLNGTYRNMLSLINLMNVISFLSILLTLGGYYYQYRNTKLYEYYPIIVTTVIITLEILCVFVFTREGKASSYDEAVLRVVEKSENWDAVASKEVLAEKKDEVEDLEVLSDDIKMSETTVEKTEVLETENHEELKTGASDDTDELNFGDISMS